MALHDGHRDRLREKILKTGIESLQPHEVLEYLLFGVIPRKDTNAIAHELINTFGSFSDVLNTDIDRLMVVKGMTRNAAIFLNTLPKTLALYTDDFNKERQNLSGRGKARAFMKSQVYGSEVEVVVIAALDARDNLIRIERMQKGTGASVPLPIRDVVDFALRTNACSILIGHNHPSGDINPSQNDINLTLEISKMLKNIKVVLQDHFIFGDNKYYSFEENGYL